MKKASTLMALLAAGALSACSGAHDQATAKNSLDFNLDIRPILSDNCFKCHGPDAEVRKAGLRLDLPGPAYGELPQMAGKHAVVPFKPDQSEMIRRISSKDPSYRMPKDNPPLTAAQISVLTAWIKGGAQYEPLWSLIPPTRPAVPTTKFDRQAVNAIDHFVFARLQKEGLAPSEEADRATLINRVSLTLTGLPPTLQEVDAFLNDRSPNAYEKVVDRLLASPAYGERMASMWMDLARWADTDGSLDDTGDRFLWPWRDWVIHAFNENLPFDQFGTWQLAGDLLPNRSRDELLATAFLRLGIRTTENGSLDEQFRIESVVDKVDTVGTTFLGLTVGCARCHDHKYDPISQKDFYSFSGFFNSNDEPGVYPFGFMGIQGGPTLSWPTPQQQQQITQTEGALQQSTAAYQAVLAQATSAARPKVAAFLQSGFGDVPRIIKTSQSSTDHGLEGTAHLVQASLNKAMVAYYPFDSVEPIPTSAYPTLRPWAKRPPPPAGLIATAEPRTPPAVRGGKAGGKPGGGKAAAKPSPAPAKWNLSLMRFSPSGMPGVGPAVVQAPQLGPGVKGQALYFTPDNKGYLAKGIGLYDRTQQFSLDFWFYPGQVYEDFVPVFTHDNVQNADSPRTGVSGYEMDFDHSRRLVFYMAHVRPYDMLAVSVKDPLAIKQWTHVAITYDGSSKVSGLHIYINGKLAPADVIRDNLQRSILPLGSFRRAPIEEFVGLAFGGRFREHPPVGSALDEFRVFDRELTPVEVGYLHEGDRVLSGSRATLNAELTDLVALQDPHLASARHALDEAREQENEAVSAVPEVLVEGDQPTARPTYRLNRGQYDQPREHVPVQGLPQIFPWNASLPANRIGLAKWLFDRKNPLTARVFVNRIWQIHFGMGLVKTAEDFGSQGSAPTDPQLLDWLAVEFMDSGWDIKHLQKLIVMSATYRQSSEESDALRKRDPENQLLARGPRFRMTAEMIRDSALSDAGLLVPTIGGPSVYPYQPDHVWDVSPDYKYPSAEQLPASEQHQRSLYTYIKRNAMNPGMQLLDAADPTVSIARLKISNTPLQSLLLLNDPQYQEAYRMMATRVLKAGGDTSGQLTLLFRLARRLYPTSAQLTILQHYYASQIQQYRSDPQAAMQVVKIGVTPVDTTVNLPQLAALTKVATVIMNAPDSYFIR